MGSDYRHFRDEWRNLWDTKFDDKVKAEDIALREFAVLFVDKGDMICDSRNAKPLDFYGIIERHEKESGTRIRPPDPKEGGLGKFIKEEIVAPSAEAKRRRTQPQCPQVRREKAAEPRLTEEGRTRVAQPIVD